MSKVFHFYIKTKEKNQFYRKLVLRKYFHFYFFSTNLKSIRNFFTFNLSKKKKPKFNIFIKNHP